MTPRADDTFVEFVHAHSAALLRAAGTLTGDGHLAQDLVQETLAKLFAAWSRVEMRNPAAYAHTTLVRTYLSMRRRRKFFERPTNVYQEDYPEASSDDAALRITVQRALADLAPIDRAVLVLRYMCDRSVDQVAVDLGRSPSAVRSASKRAIDRLRRSVDPLDLLATGDFR